MPESQHQFRRYQLFAALSLAAIATLGFLAFDHEDLPVVGALPLPWSASDASHGVPGAKLPESRDLPRGLSSPSSRRLAAQSPDAGSARDLQPGYTMAELCALTADRSYRCESGHFDGSFRPATRGSSLWQRGAQGETIAGRVLGADGAGIGGITLVAAPARAAAGADSGAGMLRFWTVTDALGAWSLDGLPEGEYTIRSRAQGEYPSARITTHTGVQDADLVVSPGLALTAEGRVVDEQGAPLPGVTVLPLLSGQASVATDNDGRFGLPVTVKPGVRRLTLRFQQPGFREATAELDVAAGDPVQVAMQPVDAWTSVKGRLRDARGALEGRTVELRPAAGTTYTATTDRDGRFTFPAVESPADYRLVALGGAGHEDREQDLHVTSSTHEVDLVTRAYRAGEVAGRVTNLDGEPVANFDLALRNTGSRAPNAVVRTDSDGRFAVTSAPAGRFVVASPSSPAILVDGLELAPGTTLDLPLVVDVGTHELRGQVVDARGRPVTASRIVLQWSHESGGVTTRTTRRAAADAEGRFAFTHLGPGSHALTIEAPGFPAASVEHDVSRGYDLTVQLSTDTASARAALMARSSPVE